MSYLTFVSPQNAERTLKTGFVGSNSRALACLLVFILFLSSCGTNTERANTKALTVHEMSLEQLTAYIDENQQLPEPQRSQSLLAVLRPLMNLDELDTAHAVSDTIDLAVLSDSEFVNLMILKGKIAEEEGEPFYAYRYLFLPELEGKLAYTELDTLKILYDARATLLYDLSEFIASVDQRLLLAPLLLEDELSGQLNHDLIWEALAEVPTETLYSLARVEKDTIKQGWYSLAAVSKNNGADFRNQLLDIEQWRVNWAEHPANLILPADLQLIMQLADTQASRVAVLLPLSGKLAAAGKAVRDGFMSAYYDDVNNGNFSPVLQFYDTHNQDINTLYDRSVYDGAELVVGPLTKTDVTQLATRKTFSVTTLALNTADPQTLATAIDPLEPIMDDAVQNERQRPAPTEEGERDQQLSNAAQTDPISADLNGDDKPDYEDGSTTIENTDGSAPDPMPPLFQQTLFQFARSIEYEARHVAEKAWRDGHRNVLILAPSTSWGERGSQSFKAHWETLGGEILDERRFKNNKREYSKLVEAAVAVNQSKQRHKRLQRMLGTRLEFEPRRRKDIDFIFMLAYGSQAQQLKPLLRFHYSAKIPVYATSQVYSGNNAKGLSDLSGLRFATMPWFFDESLNERRAVNAYGDSNDRYQTLYALGVDAYHIYPRLEQLKTIPQAKFYGSTGKLRVNENSEIIREQTWAEIVDGKAVELNTSLDSFNQ